MKFAPVHAPAVVLALAVLVVTVFIRDSFIWLDTSVVFAVMALLALSVGISYGQAGILSVAQATFGSIGAYATAIATTRYGLSPYIGLILALTLPALVAYPLALMVHRLSPLALAVATLFFGQLVDLAIRNGGNFTGGYLGLSAIPFLPGLSSPMALHLTAWVCVAVIVVLYTNLMRSSWGRAMVTSKFDALRATADGVDVPRLRCIVLSISASVAGLAGWLYAHHGTYLAPEALSTPQTLSALLMAVIGGARFVLGPVIGAVLLSFILKFLPFQEVVGMFYGGILVISLLVMPDGIMGAVQSALRGRRNPGRDAAGQPNAAQAQFTRAVVTPLDMARNVVLRCTGAGARYGRIEVCRDVNLAVQSSEKLLLLGANGAGKSSLLGAIAGIIKGGGTVTLGDRDLSRLPAHRRAAEGIAFVPEIRGNVFPSLSVRENIEIGLRLVPAKDRAQARDEVFDLFPILKERLPTPANMLSGGEQQMLAIAMASARKPALLMLDEPSQGLAPSVYRLLSATFDRLTAQKMALVVAEQNIPFACSIGNRAVGLKGGQLALAGGAELLANPERIAAVLIDDETDPGGEFAPV